MDCPSLVYGAHVVALILWRSRRENRRKRYVMWGLVEEIPSRCRGVTTNKLGNGGGGKTLNVRQRHPQISAVCPGGSQGEGPQHQSAASMMMWRWQEQSHVCVCEAICCSRVTSCTNRESTSAYNNRVDCLTKPPCILSFIHSCHRREPLTQIFLVRKKVYFENVKKSTLRNKTGQIVWIALLAA